VQRTRRGARLRVSLARTRAALSGPATRGSPRARSPQSKIDQSDHRLVGRERASSREREREERLLASGRKRARCRARCVARESRNDVAHPRSFQDIDVKPVVRRGGTALWRRFVSSSSPSRVLRAPLPFFQPARSSLASTIRYTFLAGSEDLIGPIVARSFLLYRSLHGAGEESAGVTLQRKFSGRCVMPRARLGHSQGCDYGEKDPASARRDDSRSTNASDFFCAFLQGRRECDRGIVCRRRRRVVSVRRIVISCTLMRDIGEREKETRASLQSKFLPFHFRAGKFYYPAIILHDTSGERRRLVRDFGELDGPSLLARQFEIQKRQKTFVAQANFASAFASE